MLTKLTEVDIEIILSLAENDLNESRVAKSLFMHRNNVIYHLRKVKRLTGLDPMKFYDLCKLIQRIKENEDGK